MKLKIAFKKEGKTYLASCKDFNLHAEAKTRQAAAKRIEEAFYFAIQFPDFVSAHKGKLAGLLFNTPAPASVEFLHIDAHRFLENVRAHAPPAPALSH